MTNVGGISLGSGDGVIFSFKDTSIHITGVNTITSNAGMKVYPNPNNGMFTIESSITDKASIEIYNMLGEQVNNKELIGNSNKIDMSSQPAGV